MSYTGTRVALGRCSGRVPLRGIISGLTSPRPTWGAGGDPAPLAPRSQDPIPAGRLRGRSGPIASQHIEHNSQQGPSSQGVHWAVGEAVRRSVGSAVDGYFSGFASCRRIYIRVRDGTTRNWQWSRPRLTQPRRRRDRGFRARSPTARWAWPRSPHASGRDNAVAAGARPFARRWAISACDTVRGTSVRGTSLSATSKVSKPAPCLIARTRSGTG